MGKRGPVPMSTILEDPSTGLPIEIDDDAFEPIASAKPEAKQEPELKKPGPSDPPKPKRCGRPRLPDSDQPKAKAKARALTWGKFFWGDWLGDHKLAQCSLAAQGAWMRILCMIAKEGGGSIQIESKALARLLGGVNADTLIGIINELKTTGTATCYKTVTNSATGQLLSGPPVDKSVDNELNRIIAVTDHANVTVYWTFTSHRLSREVQERENARKRQRRHRALQNRDRELK